MAKIKVSEVKSKRIKYLQDDAIPDINTPWQVDEETAYPGSRVEEFIKKMLTDLDTNVKTKIGYWCWSGSVDASNFYHLWGFASEDDCTKYKADPEGNAALLLVNEALPISTVQGDSYSAYLYCNVSKTADVVVSGNKLTAKVRFCAVKVSNGDRLNNGSMGTLIIERSTDDGSTWKVVETRKGALTSTDYADENNYTDVDLGGCLINGKQKLRLRAQYTYTADDGSEKTATSTYVLVGGSITRTTLSLTCQLNWQTPLLASTYQDKGFPISYMVYGAVAKTLHIAITGGDNKQMPEITYPLTSSDDSTTINRNIQDSTDTYKLFKHGVKTVKAWLTCDDGMGGTISSETLVNRFMMVNPTTDADKTTPYILLQNIIDKADNYAQVDICQYAVYSPKVGNDGSVTNTGDAVPVVFYLTAYAENFPADNPEEYFRIEQNVAPATVNTLNTTIEIESSDTTQKEIPAYFRVYRKDASGNEVNALQEAQNTNNLVIKVDNSESYAPKAGADFVLNPKTRNNSETNPLTIVNAKTGKTVASTWTGFGLARDGWQTSEADGQKVLRIPAGCKLNIQYNPFAQFLTTPDSAMELELDFKVSNVTNETDPIIALFQEFTVSDADGNKTTTFRGLKMLPLKGNVCTKSNAVDSETDFQWQEGVRTHIAINVHNAVAPNKGDAIVPDSTTLDTKATKIALVRVFINGDIKRELRYSITDAEEFGTSAMSNGGITIGQDGADIDIYSIRVYQNNALEHTEVLNNWISTLPTTAEKQAMRKQNDILTAGKVDIEKCKQLGKRCLVWHGTEPYKENTSAQLGWWEIIQYDKEGNYLPEFSGTLCKETKSLKATRQGSTANTYYYSNLQTKMSDVKATITVKLTDLHSSIKYEVHEVDQTDGTKKKMVSLCGGNLGKNFPVKETAVDYEYAQKDGEDAVVVPDGWVDGNGKYRGVGYIVAEGTPMAQKLVNKINYASSMQSHLTGVNNLYNDLHKIIVGKNSLQKACETARVSKYTEPFLFFTQAEGSDTAVYRGPCTFGAGKMDKPTWGYVKKLHPNFAMIEGSDNNYDLTDMRVPFTWNTPDCPENITYSPDDEGFFYNGKQCLDYDGGSTEADGTPKANIISIVQNTWNFLYLHSPMIEYYKGTFDAFQKSDKAKDVFNKYWCTDGDDAYKLKRYDYVEQKWVDAGLWNSATKAWGVVDLRTDAMTKPTYDASSNQSQYAALNVELRAAIVGDCKKNIGFYFRVDSLKLYYTLIIHLLAGTDSCSKNTYYVIDPTAVDVTIDGVTKTCYLLEMHTDDVDTMLPIDNNGRSTKPYYIDRMHPYVDGDTTTEKYEGMHSVIFNLCEQMWEGTKELQAMMKAIFTAMESLVKESDYLDGWTGGSKVSVLGCLWKYIYYVHYYIPKVAYNEAARIRYEYPEMLGFVSYGSGARGVRPITQSNGSLAECELEFIIRRLILMASYAAWGPFFDGKSGNLGISEATESFSMQAFHTPDSATSLNDYTFNVVPHQYIYPTGMMGQTNIDPHVRVAPGETFSLDLGSTTSNDTGMSIMGINFYRSIGNLGDMSTTPANTITIKGNRLTEFKVEPSKYYIDTDSGKQTPAFRPGAIVVAAKNIKTLSLKGCTATTGSIDLSDLTRLESVDVRQTKLSDVSLPETNVLHDIQYPSTIQSIYAKQLGGLKLLTAEGYSNIGSMVFGKQTPSSVVVPFVTSMAANATQNVNISLVDIAWNTPMTMATLQWMLQQTGFKGTGYLTVSSQLTYSSVQAVCKVLGDDTFYPSAKLYVKSSGGNFLLGEDSVVSGKSVTYQLKSIPQSSVAPTYKIADYDSTNTNADGSTTYTKGVAHLNSKTGVLTTDESQVDSKVTVQGWFDENGHVDRDLTISKTTYPSELRPIIGTQKLNAEGTYNYEATLIPVNFTGHVDYLWELASGKTDGLTLVPDGKGCVVKVTQTPPASFNKVMLKLTVTCGNGQILTQSKWVYYSVEQPIMTSDSNAAAMAVCYKQGWAANADYMLRSEAAAVTDLGTAFSKNTSLMNFTELQYFSGLTAIAESAFSACTFLDNIIIPQSVKSIGAHAFGGCVRLTGIALPNVETIGDYAFNGCTSLATVSIGDSLKSIGTNVFVNCVMTEMTFGKNLTTINKDTFAHCQKLAKVTFASNHNLTVGMMFKDCQKLNDYGINSISTDVVYLKAVDGVIYRNDEQTLVAYPQARKTRPTLTGYTIAPYAFYYSLLEPGTTVYNPTSASQNLEQLNTDFLKGALDDYRAAGFPCIFNSKGTKMAKIKSATFDGTYSGMTSGTVTFEDGTTCNINTLNDKGCNWMVYRPRLYFKSGVNADKNNQEELQFGGLLPIDGGHSFKEKFVGMFKAYVQNGVLKSQPNRIPTGSQVIATFQAQAEAGGKGYGLWNYSDWCKENALHISLFGNTNQETNIGVGRINNSDNVRNIVTGFTLPLVGTEHNYGTRATVDSAGRAVNCLNFLDMEGLGEQIWEFVIGYRHDESTVYLWDDNSWSETHDADRTLPYTISSDNQQYIKFITGGEYFDMTPRTIGASSGTGWCDGTWASTSGRLLFVGGRAYSGSFCGPAASDSDGGFSSSWAAVGARLAFYSTPVTVSGAELVASLG